MMNKGLLRVKMIVEDKVSMTDMPGRDVCQIQLTLEGPPKLIFSKLTVTHKENYNAIPYNYGHSFQGTGRPLVLPEIAGLTRSGRCFTLAIVVWKRSD